MPRLPNPGGDKGTWGEVLNDYLSQSHKGDGTLKDDVVGSSQLQDNSVTNGAIAPNSVTSASLATDAVNSAAIADGSVAETHLASAVQTKLNAGPVIADGSIAKTKLETTVKASLDKADASASQTDIDDKLTTTDLDSATAVNIAASGSETQTALEDASGLQIKKTSGLGLSPFNFGAVGDGTADDHVALQAFFDYVTANDVGTAYVAGTFKSTVALTMGAALTKTFSGRCKITFTGTGAAGFTITGWTGGRWESLELIAPAGGVAVYAAKTWHTGLHLTDQTSRNQFGCIQGGNWAFALVACSGGNTTACEFDMIKAHDCGSGAIGAGGTPHYGLTTTFTNPTNSGSSGSVVQTCVIDVATLPPSFITSGYHGALDDAPYFLRIKDAAGKTRLHYITAVNSEASQLTVFPWINPTSVGVAVADYVFGGALYLHGADSNVHSVGLIDAQRCGTGISAGSLYPPHLLRLLTQFCGAAIVIGRTPNGAVLGGRFDGCYFEANSEDVIYLSRPSSDNVYNWIGSEYSLDLSKSYVAGAPRISTTFAESGAFTNFENTSFAYRGRLHRAEKRSLGSGNGATQTPVLDRPDMQLVLSGDSFTITPSLNLNLHRLTGYDALQIVVGGSGANAQPTGTITFPAPAGYTINGGSSDVTFTSLTAATRFLYRFDTVAMNAIVTIAGATSYWEQVYFKKGALTTSVGALRIYAERTMTIRDIRISVGTAPAATAVIADININGNTIFSTQANRPTVAVAGNTSGLVSNMNTTIITAGQYFTVDIDQIDATATDLTVQIRCA